MESTRIDDFEGEYSIAMLQTQALLEVLTAYFEAGIQGRTVEVPETTLATFLYQVSENLDRMEGLVTDIVKESRKKPVKLRLAAG